MADHIADIADIGDSETLTSANARTASGASRAGPTFHVPTEIVIQIISYIGAYDSLGRRTLKSLRCCSRVYCSIATPILFEVISPPRVLATKAHANEWALNLRLAGFLEGAKALQVNLLSFVGLRSLEELFNKNKSAKEASWYVHDGLKRTWFTPMLQKMEDSYAQGDRRVVFHERGTKDSNFFRALISILDGLMREKSLHTLPEVIVRFDDYLRIRKHDRDGVYFLAGFAAVSYALSRAINLRIGSLRFEFCGATFSVGWDLPEESEAIHGETRRRERRRERVEGIRRDGIGPIDHLRLWLPGNYNSREHLTILNISNLKIGYINLRYMLHALTGMENLTIRSVPLLTSIRTSNPSWRAIIDAAGRHHPNPCWGDIFFVIDKRMSKLEEIDLANLSYQEPSQDGGGDIRTQVDCENWAFLCFGRWRKEQGLPKTYSPAELDSNPELWQVIETFKGPEGNIPVSYV